MTNMKLLSLLICVLLSVFVTEAFDESDLDATDKKCIEELNIDKAVIIGNFDENDFIKEGNDVFNKFYTCAWKKDGLQNEDGSINPSALEIMIALKLEKLHPGKEKEAHRAHLANQSRKACENVKGSDDGDTCVKIYNCLLKNI